MKRASHVLLRRYRSRFHPDARRAFRLAHQSRSPLQGQEYRARGAARRAALSGYAAADEADSARLRFRDQGLRPPHPWRSAVHTRHRKDFRRLEAADRWRHRLCEDVQAGAVRRRRRQGGYLPGWPEQFLDAEGAGIRQPFRLSEFLFPCRDHAWNFAPQRRRNRQARFSRGSLVALSSGWPARRSPAKSEWLAALQSSRQCTIALHASSFPESNNMSQPTKLFEPFKLGPITLPNR